MTLRREGLEGPGVCSITKSWKSDNMTITML